MRKDTVCHVLKLNYQNQRAQQIELEFIFHFICMGMLQTHRLNRVFLAESKVTNV